MVYIDKGALVLRLQSEDPENLLTEIRNALTAVTSVLVESDEFNYHPSDSWCTWNIDKVEWWTCKGRSKPVYFSKSNFSNLNSNRWLNGMSSTLEMRMSVLMVGLVTAVSIRAIWLNERSALSAKDCFVWLYRFRTITNCLASFSRPSLSRMIWRLPLLSFMLYKWKHNYSTCAIIIYLHLCVCDYKQSTLFSDGQSLT